MKYTDRDYEVDLKSLRGKTIAIVYIFEKEDAAGFDHFLTWKNDIITGWFNAVYELECLPFIVDVRTFIQKASCCSLPHIDYVINLNSGCYELPTMGLIPSICSFLAIPCIPCDAVSIVTSEDKRISNLIARGLNLQTPKDLSFYRDDGIFRPKNLGNSIGLRKGNSGINLEKGIYQEFIPGYDITIPIAYNAYINDIDLLPPILYLPHSLSPSWIFDEEEKIKDNGFITLSLPGVEKNTKDKLIEFAKVFPIKSYGRIDARIKSEETKLSKKITAEQLSHENLFFIEINSMPTIEQGDGFDLAFNAILNHELHEKHSFHRCISKYKEIVKQPTINGFLLSCSMISVITSKY